jgi:hypothetical protein
MQPNSQGHSAGSHVESRDSPVIEHGGSTPPAPPFPPDGSSEEMVLLDLHEDALAAIAAHTADAVDLCCLSAACRTFHRLIMEDDASTQLVWASLVAELIPVPPPERAPCAQLYRALSSCDDLRWLPTELKVCRADPQRMKHGLVGRTGAAVCELAGASLLFGGTLNGNHGPVLGDLLVLDYDEASKSVSIWPAPMEVLDADGMEIHPGPRRGHSMTSTQLADGSHVACVLGGWGYDELTMAPALLHVVDEGGLFRWSRPQVRGSLPDGRAFHTATEVARSSILVYGGLGSGCCRNDLALLDLHRMLWSQPAVGGIPRCPGGRAGHGACFFMNRERRGELLLISGALRSASGDSHLDSVDVIEVESSFELDAHGDFGGTTLSLRWSDQSAWGNIVLPKVRTLLLMTSDGPPSVDLC